MDIFDTSLAAVRKYLQEEPILERRRTWQEVKQLGLKGPTVDEYFNFLQEELEDFNKSFGRTTSEDFNSPLEPMQPYFNNVQMAFVAVDLQISIAA